MERYMSICRHNFIKYFIIFSLTILIISISGSLIVKACSGNTQPEYKYYTSIVIDPADTLWSIAERYKSDDCDMYTYIDNIKHINNMTSDTLYSGQSIIVYYYSSELK